MLQGSGYSGGIGSLKELPVRKRAPLLAYLDLLGPDIAVKIDNPNGGAAQQAIADLVQQAKANGIINPARISFEQIDTNSTKEGLLKLGFSAKYLGGEASAKLEQTRTAQETTIMASFIQRLYTVSIVTPSTPADFFTSDFAKADLAEQEQAGRLSVDNPPVVVGSIAYGRMLLYSITSKATKNELTAALSAAFNGGAASGSFQLDAKQQQILNEARYSVVALGGEESAVLDLIKNRKLGDFFASVDPTSAIPISYQVNNIGDDSAAKFSETTDYNLTECQALPNNPVDVGDIVRIDNFRAYSDGPTCTNVDLYGSLSVNGQSIWQVGDNEISQHPNRWQEFTFDGIRAPIGHPIDQRYRQQPGPWEFALFATEGQSGGIRIQGSISDGNWPFLPSVNLYDWYEPFPFSYGDREVDGGSKNCRVALRFSLNKTADLIAWEP